MEHYDRRVDVLYQEKGWADDVTSVASMKLIGTQVCGPESIMFLDNLHGHRCSEYEEAAEIFDINLFFTPADCTDICAVNDHHIGKMVQSRIKEQFEDTAGLG